MEREREREREREIYGEGRSELVTVRVWGKKKKRKRERVRERTVRERDRFPIFFFFFLWKTTYFIFIRIFHWLKIVFHWPVFFVPPNTEKCGKLSLQKVFQRNKQSVNAKLNWNNAMLESLEFYLEVECLGM